MKRVWVAAGVLLLTGLSWFEFPGHTWLQQDTQIYVPILEHLRDPTALRRDMLVERPHVSFTLYDESARAWARVTGLGFREVLEAEQFVTRGLGIWGLYLMAAALGLSAPAALLAAGIVSLGATIAGPAVLSFEIEPDPRGFAVPLLFLAIGLAAVGRHRAAGIAGAAAFVMHPPATLPFWAVYGCFGVMRRKFQVLIPLAIAGVILAAFAFFQDGARTAQQFFTRLPAALEAVQRTRAPYSYLSAWWRDWLAHYLVLYAASLAAIARLRKRAPDALRFFAIGLPLAGMLSMPVSYLLLEQLKWGLMPQWQPMRALLFVTVMTQLLATATGVIAAEGRRYVEAFAWLALAYLVPANTSVTVWPGWNRALTVALMAMCATLAAWAGGRKYRWGAAALMAVAVGGFFAVPHLAGVLEYPHLHTGELDQLSDWARISTRRDAVFLFADAGKQLQSGIFRAEALRAVYVDWKAGGQVNYFPDFAAEWRSRWQSTLAVPFDARNVSGYRAMGIDYIVLRPVNRLADRTPVFENAAYLVYAM